jgi:hypothetical protein
LSFLLEPRHCSIPQNQLNCSLAERKQIADRGSFCRMHLKKPSFRQTDSSSSWTHKSDSLPNFGVNTCPFNCGIKVIYSGIDSSHQRLQIESVQHLSLFAIRRNLRLDPNTRSPCSEFESPMAAQNQAAQVNSPSIRFIRHLGFRFYLRFLFRFPSGAFHRAFDSYRGQFKILLPWSCGKL